MQDFTVDEAKPFLRFDFTLPTTSLDSTGTGASEFLEAVIVGIDDGVDFFDVLLLDPVGHVLDPSGTAPGPVSVGPPTNPNFAFNLAADLSTLAGQSVTLFFDVLAEDNGFQLEAIVDNVQTSPPVPEPSALALLVMGVGGAFGVRPNAVRHRNCL